MSKVKGLPDLSAVKKLIERYVKVESSCTIAEASERAGFGVGVYYRRMNSPENFTLGELRSLAKVLRIPLPELITAIEAAVRYQ